ncbi:MAG: tRNA pseudouridine(38-40) synthase TruA [Pseudomonadota bacterium]
MSPDYYAMGVTYDGAPFHGWQRQRNDVSVQGVLEDALSRVADHPVTIAAAGRTDTGVHATGQVISFRSGASRSLRDWQRGANALTPSAVSVDWVVAASADFHPRYSATARTYHYLFHDVSHPDPLLAGRVWSTTGLDSDAMHRAAQQLLGEHDFSGFRAAGCQSLTPMRRINRCLVWRQGPLVVLEIEANAFLLHMVRNIARGLQDVGRHRDSGLIAAVLAGRDRTRLGATAPAQGLYLTRVSYPGFAIPPPRAGFFQRL